MGSVDPGMISELSRSPLEIVIPITQAMVDDRSTEDAPTGKMTLVSASNTLQCPDKSSLEQKVGL